MIVRDMHNDRRDEVKSVGTLRGESAPRGLVVLRRQFVSLRVVSTFKEDAGWEISTQFNL